MHYITWGFWTGIIVFGLGGTLLQRKRRSWGYPHRAAVAKYEAQSLLVNSSEWAAWHLLHELPLGAHAICPKVRLEDFLEALGPEWMRLRGYVKSRHIDFLLIDESCRPMLAIEVDGSSHNRPDRVWRDARVNEALSAAGVPFLRLRVGEDWRPRLLAWRALQGAPSPQAHSVAIQSVAVPTGGFARRRV